MLPAGGKVMAAGPGERVAMRGPNNLSALCTVGFNCLIQVGLCRDCVEPRPVRRLRMSRRSG